MKQQADIRALIIVFLSLVALFSHARNSGKPNIIYILTDQQSANALFIIRENHTIAGETKEEIANNLLHFISERNHCIDKSTVGFQAIMDVLTKKLLSQNGTLIADNYNFISEQFNIWFALQQMINASEADEKTKSSALEKFGISIIKNVKPVDLEKEKEKWNNYNQ